MPDSTLHICGGIRNATRVERVYRPCRRCAKRRVHASSARKRLHVAWFEDWYGWTFACVACAKFDGGWHHKRLVEALRNA